MNPIGKTTARAAKLAASVAFADGQATVPDGHEYALTGADSLGIQAISNGTAGFLTFLARACGAKNVVEIGTGSGTSGLALLAGMGPDGVLTSIDIENEHQSLARKVFEGQGIPRRRARLIAGAALAVLPKLSDGAYDLVFVDGDPLEVPEYLAQSARLLRPGGVAVVNHVLWRDLVADEANETDEAVIMREALAMVAEDSEWFSTILPIGDGLLLLVR